MNDDSFVYVVQGSEVALCSRPSESLLCPGACAPFCQSKTIPQLFLKFGLALFICWWFCSFRLVCHELLLDAVQATCTHVLWWDSARFLADSWFARCSHVSCFVRSSRLLHLSVKCSARCAATIAAQAKCPCPLCRAERALAATTPVVCVWFWSLMVLFRF